MTQAQYDERVQDIAKDTYDKVGRNSSKASDYIHETVDGLDWIIYNKYHDDVLRYSNHPKEGYEQGLVDANASLAKGGVSQLTMELAYWALYADVQEAYNDYEPDEDEESFCPTCNEEKYEDDAYCNGDKCGNDKEDATK